MLNNTTNEGACKQSYEVKQLDNIPVIVLPLVEAANDSLSTWMFSTAAAGEDDAGSEKLFHRLQS